MRASPCNSSSWIIACSLAIVVGCASGVDPDRAAPALSGTGGVLGTAGTAGSGLTTFGSGGSTVAAGGSTTIVGAGGTTSNGGAVGSSGAGGTVAGNGGGASTGGARSIDAGPPAVGVLVAQYFTADDPKNGDLKPQLNLVNRSTRTIPVAALTIHYYYTIDGSPPATTDYQELHIDYADIGRISGGSTNPKLSFAKLAKPQKGADHYIEVGFDGPYELAPGGATNQIQLRVNWKNYTQTYDETNDYSWDGTKTAFTDWKKVTVYQNGVLVWGTEPDGTTPKLPSDGGTDGASTPDGSAPSDAATPPTDAGAARG